MDSYCSGPCFSNAPRICYLRIWSLSEKNTVNILFKNVFIISIGILTYALFGFNTHYPGDFNGWFSWGGMIGDLNADGGSTWGYGGLD